MTIPKQPSSSNKYLTFDPVLFDFVSSDLIISAYNFLFAMFNSSI